MPEYEPLPVDVVGQIRLDFGELADAIFVTLLLKCREIGSEFYAGDRLIRCIVFAARGNESRLDELIELHRADFRDVIMAAEYDVFRFRIRDFSKPFGSAEIYGAVCSNPQIAKE